MYNPPPKKTSQLSPHGQLKKDCIYKYYLNLNFNVNFIIFLI